MGVFVCGDGDVGIWGQEEYLTPKHLSGAQIQIHFAILTLHDVILVGVAGPNEADDVRT